MNTGHPITNTKIDPSSIPEPKHLEKNTLANYPWAKESAHKRRYDAVLLIEPSFNFLFYIKIYINLERIRLFR